jgi:hypothetical protein
LRSPLALATIREQQDAGAVLDAGGRVAFMDQGVKVLALLVRQADVKVLAHANSITRNQLINLAEY